MRRDPENDRLAATITIFLQNLAEIIITTVEGYQPDGMISHQFDSSYHN